MKIPKKINPDNLKDSIVQVLFNPGIAPELVLGSFNHVLSDIFKFVAASPKRREVKVTDREGLIIDQLERAYFLDNAEQVKVDVGANAIVLTCSKNIWDGKHIFPSFKPLLADYLK